MTKATLIPLVLMLVPASTPITVKLTSPVSGTTVSGTINLTAEVSTNVVRVEYYMDGKLIGVIDRRPQIPQRLRVLHASNTHTNLP